jgi:hypothetical protein
VVANSESQAGIVVVNAADGMPTKIRIMNKYTQCTGIIVRPFNTIPAKALTIDTRFRPKRSMKYATDIEPTIDPIKTETESKLKIRESLSSNGVVEC